MEKNQEKALVKFGIDPNQVIHSNGHYWMTAEQIGRALGYNQPAQSVSNLYNRNKEELTPYCSFINLMTEAGMRKTLTFNADGQWLISIMAKTAKAAKLRKFVIAMLKALERKELVPAGRVKEAVAEGRNQGLAVVPMMTTAPAWTATTMPMVGTPVDGTALYDVFWARMDYLLGKRAKWMDCKEADRRVKQGIVWGSNENLCNSFNIKDDRPSSE